MAERSHDDLERALSRLGRQLDFPPTPDLARSVHARVSGAPPRRAWSWGFWQLPRRGWSTAAVALTLCAVLALALALALSHSARSTVADRLGIGGVDVELVPQSTPTIAPVGANLDLGERTTLADAADALGFQPVGPPTGLYGPPDEVWVKQLPAGQQLTYLYRPRDGLPAAAGSGVGLLISQFAGHTNASFIQKQLGADARLEYVTVDGANAFWISGAPHVFYYEDEAGQIQPESLRLAGNTLIWEREGITVRIESALTQAPAIALAEALAPQP